MTPIKLIVVAGLRIYAVDHADHARLIALAPLAPDADWLGESLAAYHRVPLRQAHAEFGLAVHYREPVVAP